MIKLMSPKYIYKQIGNFFLNKEFRLKVYCMKTYHNMYMCGLDHLSGNSLKLIPVFVFSTEMHTEGMPGN